MREILFRGKRIDNGEWVYGCLLNNIYGASKPVFISDSSYTDDNRIANDDWEFVIPETVGQYTGLTDKNDKKIFEGDIVKVLDEFDHKVIYLIDYKDASFCANQKGVNFSIYLSRLKYPYTVILKIQIQYKSTLNSKSYYSPFFNY